MADDDFRVSTDFRRHPKIVKLEAQYGAEGVLSLFELWAFAGRYRPKGILSKMNSQDIAIAARWTGDSQEFVDFLVDIRLLDKRGNGGYSIHDWKEHNGYLFYKPERRKKAQNAAKSKHTNGRNDLRSAKTRFEQPKCSAPSPAPTPAPVPTPNPTPEREGPTAQDILSDYRTWKRKDDPLNRGGAGKLFELQTTYDHLFGDETLNWIISHTKDVEVDILKRPERFADFYQTDKWFRWIAAILHRNAKEKKFGQSGYKALMTAEQEDAHYQQHRNEALCRVKQPDDEAFKRLDIAGILPGEDG